MAKIEEFEKILIKHGLSEENLFEYEKLLKRVRGNFLRLQHCYTTAARFPFKRSKQAISLIEWGLEKYPSTWYPTYSAYFNIGCINEQCGKYKLAYEAYLKANAVLEESQASYRCTLSGNLFWMLLHIDNFNYSEQLEDYYNAFKEIDDFEKAFINNEFRIAVAETIIFSHKEMKNEAVQAYEKALKLSKPNIVSRIQCVLDKHNVKDTLRNTPECATFLKTVRL